MSVERTSGAYGTATSSSAAGQSVGPGARFRRRMDAARRSRAQGPCGDEIDRPMAFARRLEPLSFDEIAMGAKSALSRRPLRADAGSDPPILARVRVSGQIVELRIRQSPDGVLLNLTAGPALALALAERVEALAAALERHGVRAASVRVGRRQTSAAPAGDQSHATTAGRRAR